MRRTVFETNIKKLREFLAIMGADWYDNLWKIMHQNSGSYRNLIKRAALSGNANFIKPVFL